ncbi:hypothetical protein MHYP_G00001240 [Metynnis hypsauchen]
MASLYQRFTGKINTSKSFPHPPEASHLLGGQVEGEEKAGKAPQPAADGRVRAQYRKRNACEDEDIPIPTPKKGSSDVEPEYFQGSESVCSLAEMFSFSQLLVW